MPLIRIRRFHSLRRLLRHPVFRLLLVVFFVWDTLDVLSIASKQQVDARQKPERRARNTKRIYIASQHWNNEIVLRSHWNAAVLALVQELGVGNVYVAVHESGSWDNTKGALKELDEQLEAIGVKRQITLSDVTHEEEIARQPAEGEAGWIETPRGRTELRRIPFLAKLRNKVLEPLEELVSQGQHFDHVLFLNDVVFTTEDILTLLETNDGHYAAACSMDFAKPPLYYDTFALRDSSGHETVMQTWPYFRSRTSRHAMLKSEPVPVASCWNGVVAMPAKPFVAASEPLRFRGISDQLALAHLEGSECCLIHADNPLSASKGVFVNPKVRVGYSGQAYEALTTEYAVLSALKIYQAIWTNRIKRWTTTPFFKESVVHGRVKKWRKRDKANEEPGEFCLVNEMQVLIDIGWKHL